MSFYATDRQDVQFLMAEASAALGHPLPPPKDVFHFGDEKRPSSGVELLENALRGLKTGTTTWPIPQPRHWGVGDLSVIMDSCGRPAAVMRTLSLVECRFGDVTEEFALSEYEGSWQDYMDGHRRFFKAQGTGPFDDDCVVLCERFEIIYQRKR
ncbi:hypothetical protein NLU13_6720 [Sarocladium strictum]|uniref:ASCH domain-containing protein n=1 Tax=Sarocladium strictum TaxID=5046 RepID=A0AA39GDW2_SARSR|nr:hypothetical protein NLU13_6720 [Sarocladium strictum]